MWYNNSNNNGNDALLSRIIFNDTKSNGNKEFYCYKRGAVDNDKYIIKAGIVRISKLALIVAESNSNN